MMDAVHAAFVAILVMAIAAFVTTLLLKEIPLRKTIASPEPDHGPPAQEPEAPAVMD